MVVGLMMYAVFLSLLLLLMVNLLLVTPGTVIASTIFRYLKTFRCSHFIVLHYYLYLFFRFENLFLFFTDEHGWHKYFLKYAYTGILFEFRSNSVFRFILSWWDNKIKIKNDFVFDNPMSGKKNIIQFSFHSLHKSNKKNIFVFLYCETKKIVFQF